MEWTSYIAPPQCVSTEERQRLMEKVRDQMWLGQNALDVKDLRAAFQSTDAEYFAAVALMGIPVYVTEARARRAGYTVRKLEKQVARLKSAHDKARDNTRYAAEFAQVLHRAPDPINVIAHDAWAAAQQAEEATRAAMDWAVALLNEIPKGKAATRPGGGKEQLIERPFPALARQFVVALEAGGLPVDNHARAIEAWLLQIARILATEILRGDETDDVGLEAVAAAAKDAIAYAVAMRDRNVIADDLTFFKNHAQKADYF